MCVGGGGGVVTYLPHVQNKMSSFKSNKWHFQVLHVGGKYVSYSSTRSLLIIQGSWAVYCLPLVRTANRGHHSGWGRRKRKKNDRCNGERICNCVLHKFT